MKEILERLDRIDSRLDRIDTRFDQITGQFAQVDARFDQIAGQFAHIDARLDRVDARFSEVDGRFDRIEMQLHRQGVLLESVSSDLKQTMEAVIGNREVMDSEFTRVRAHIDERVQPLEWAGRHFSKKLATVTSAKRPRRKTRA